MKRPVLFTDKWLKRRYACNEQIDLFRATFPNGAEPTKQNFRKALKAGLEVEWLVEYCVPANVTDRFDKEWIALRHRYFDTAMDDETFDKKEAKLIEKVLLEYWK